MKIRREHDAGPHADVAHRGGAASPLDATPTSLLGITIRLPGDAGRAGPERVVRPALAVLYRVAVGPAADRYVPRFLAFERSGGARAGWHWPALLLPAAWAFYRRLWGFGAVFALLPLVGALAFRDLGPQIEQSRLAWFVCAALLIGLAPGVIPALFADALLYRRLRGVVAEAERRSADSAHAVDRLAQDPPTSLAAAVLLGGGAFLCVAALLGPGLRAGYVDLDVRRSVVESLAAVRDVQRQIEENWPSARLVPRQTANETVRAHAGGRLIEDVNVSPATGRVRVAWGPTVPQLAGKTVLLAPTLDAQDHVRWVCVPVDIPERHLPRACRV